MSDNKIVEAKAYYKYGIDCDIFSEPVLSYAKLALVALKKQTPKKVTHEASLYKCCTCPTCKNVIDEFTKFVPNQPRIRVQTLYCKYCGQALDWSDTE